MIYSDYMSDLLLAKQNLPPGTIDAMVGEPHLIRDNLYSLLNISDLCPDISNQNIFEYTAPAGYEPLVKFLEDKHQAPVIISSGAKQAIGSLFYSLKCNDTKSIYLDNPWWSLFPPLITMHHLCRSLSFGEEDSAYLLVHPNNPDGSIKSNEELFKIKETCQEKNIPLIHDGAYYSHNYLPPNYNLSPIGDVQVFTCSKMFGLSQLRIGYSVFYNTKFYNKTLQYMENMTVGTSILSQMFALNIFKYLASNKDIETLFEQKCFNQISENRNLIKNISSDIISDQNELGMFLWAKCKDLNKFNQAKINVADGIHFGKHSHIRMNLAFKKETIKDIVDRLNSLV
jgi:aspartate/methionine/tyrosine aminotransferase